MMTRVTVPGYIGTVSFHPSSLSSGGMMGPVKLMDAGEAAQVEQLPVDDLDVHQVEVHRVHVAGGVEDLPHFRVAGIDILLGGPHAFAGGSSRYVAVPT